ncbi:MAG: dihydrolipoamide acetyltransferase family protein [Phycisphaerales bacterium]|nr:dihydrolipoamide acetyltransferase family protein [Phycisphaerales bacterium]
MSREFVLPDLGEGIAEAQIVRLLVKEGDRIESDQYLMEVETDKAAVEIPSPYTGIARKIHVKEGQTVNVGAVIVTFDDGEASGKASAPGKTESKTASKPAAAAQSSAPVSAARAPIVGPVELHREATVAPAAPAVRKLAREMGLDIDTIKGTGPGGRITREDLDRAKSGPRPTALAAPRAGDERPAAPPTARIPGVQDTDKWGRVYREPINQIRKTIANQMSRSAFTAVHVTHSDEADITELDRVRHQLNEATGNDPKLTIMSFVIRATCIALRKYPIFNSSFDLEAGQIVYKDYVNIGIAVDTERGLIVPVVRNADQLSLRGITAALRGIAERVRTNQFAIEDLRGGTFTITNVGALGGMFSTPIINYPEVAILGMGRSRKVPVLRDGQLAEALMLPLNVSFDHRATDGANAARFTGEIMSYLQTPAKFLLD